MLEKTVVCPRCRGGNQRFVILSSKQVVNATPAPPASPFLPLLLLHLRVPWAGESLAGHRRVCGVSSHGATHTPMGRGDGSLGNEQEVGERTSGGAPTFTPALLGVRGQI